MAQHGIDKKAAKRIAQLLNQGEVKEAQKLIALMSPNARQDVIDRIIRGIQISQGNA